MTSDEDDEESGNESDAECAESTTVNNRNYSTPAQDALNLEISVMEKKLIAAIESRDAGFAKPEIQKEILTLQKELEKKKKIVKAKKDKAARQKKYRVRNKKILLKLKETHPEITTNLPVSLIFNLQKRSEKF